MENSDNTAVNTQLYVPKKITRDYNCLSIKNFNEKNPDMLLERSLCSIQIKHEFDLTIYGDVFTTNITDKDFKDVSVLVNAFKTLVEEILFPEENGIELTIEKYFYPVASGKTKIGILIRPCNNITLDQEKNISIMSAFSQFLSMVSNHGVSNNKNLFDNLFTDEIHQKINLFAKDFLYIHGGKKIQRPFGFMSLNNKIRTQNCIQYAPIPDTDLATPVTEKIISYIEEISGVKNQVGIRTLDNRIVRLNIHRTEIPKLRSLICDEKLYEITLITRDEMKVKVLTSQDFVSIRPLTEEEILQLNKRVNPDHNQRYLFR